MKEMLINYYNFLDMCNNFIWDKNYIFYIWGVLAFLIMTWVSYEMFKEDDPEFMGIGLGIAIIGLPVLYLVVSMVLCVLPLALGILTPVLAGGLIYALTLCKKKRPGKNRAS